MIDSSEMDEVEIIQWDRSGVICMYSIEFFIDGLIRFHQMGRAQSMKFHVALLDEVRFRG